MVQTTIQSIAVSGLIHSWFCKRICFDTCCIWNWLQKGKQCLSNCEQGMCGCMCPAGGQMSVQSQLELGFRRIWCMHLPSLRWIIWVIWQEICKKKSVPFKRSGSSRDSLECHLNLIRCGRPIMNAPTNFKVNKMSGLSRNMQKKCFTIQEVRQQLGFSGVWPNINQAWYGETHNKWFCRVWRQLNQWAVCCGGVEISQLARGQDTAGIL